MFVMGVHLFNETLLSRLTFGFISVWGSLVVPACLGRTRFAGSNPATLTCQIAELLRFVMDVETRRAYSRNWYAKQKTNGSDYLKRKLRLQKDNRHRTKTWLHGLKHELGCSLCLEREPYCLEFHHVVADSKKSNVADMITNNNSRKEILNEIAKCTLLCANCHRKVTHGIIKL